MSPKITEQIFNAVEETKDTSLIMIGK